MIYMFFADGFEETEAISSWDVLKRAGIEIKTVGLSDTVTGAHGMKIVPEITVNEVTTDGLKGIILPGGMPGTTNLENNEKVQEIIDYCYENRLLLAAICAAPSVFGKKGILRGKEAICFPGFEEFLEGAEISENKTAVSGNVITSKAMGSAIDFGLAIVEYFMGKEKAEEIKNSIFY